MQLERMDIVMGVHCYGSTLLWSILKFGKVLLEVCGHVVRHLGADLSVGNRKFPLDLLMHIPNND